MSENGDPQSMPCLRMIGIGVRVSGGLPGGALPAQYMGEKNSKNLKNICMEQARRWSRRRSRTL